VSVAPSVVADRAGSPRPRPRARPTSSAPVRAGSPRPRPGGRRALRSRRVTEAATWRAPGAGRLVRAGSPRPRPGGRRAPGAWSAPDHRDRDLAGAGRSVRAGSPRPRPRPGGRRAAGRSGLRRVTEAATWLPTREARRPWHGCGG
jgi:hypothetical protein